MSLAAQLIDNEYFEDMRKHIKYNYQIADFYRDRYEAESGSTCSVSEDTQLSLFAKEEEEPPHRKGYDDYTIWLNKSRYINGCGKLWDIDHYKALNIKDIQRVNLCHDKFCYNCQKNLSQARFNKYAPILDDFQSTHKILHVVFTVPNCEAEELLPLLNKMYDKFRFVLRYFKGQAKVRGVDFVKYGYAGAVRGLEITVNQKQKNFHPHFHCMLLLRRGVDLRGKHTNAYSFDHFDPTKKHKFSDFEILLQKIWYLLLNDCKVTAENIERLKIGYDVQASDPQGSYHEVFKYACKGAFKEGEDGEGAAIHKDYYFWALYEALYSRRMIQGYGVLHKINDFDSIITEEDAAAIYAAYVARLQEFEKPVFEVESLDEVCERSKSGCKYISKNNFLRNLTEQKRQERKEQGGKP